MKDFEKQWEAHGLLCGVKQNYCGNNNGYVRVVKGHPFHGLGYSSVAMFDANVARLKDRADEVPFDGILAALSGTVHDWLRTPAGYIKIHGGLTFAGLMDENPDEWWFGFDTGHSGDYICLDLQSKILMARVEAIGMDPGEGESYMKEWTAYANRVKTGEIQRDRDFECRLEKKKYWTVEDVAAETEKMAEQLSMVQMLGVAKYE